MAFSVCMFVLIGYISFSSCASLLISAILYIANQRTVTKPESNILKLSSPAEMAMRNFECYFLLDVGTSEVDISMSRIFSGDFPTFLGFHQVEKYIYQGKVNAQDDKSSHKGLVSSTFHLPLISIFHANLWVL